MPSFFFHHTMDVKLQFVGVDAHIDPYKLEFAFL